METHLGTLTSFDAVPDKETTRKIYDDLDLRRATAAFLATLPIASMAAMESGLRSLGEPNKGGLCEGQVYRSKAAFCQKAKGAYLHPGGRWVIGRNANLLASGLSLTPPPGVAGKVSCFITWTRSCSRFGSP